jgi:hypothetical protein
MITWKNEEEKSRFASYGLYYKGELIIMGDIPLLFDIIYSKIVHYHLNWYENYNYDRDEILEFLENKLGLLEYKEYKKTEDGVIFEAYNTINSLRFPFFISVEDKLIVREINLSQKWKVKKYLNDYHNQYKVLLGEAISDLQQMGRNYFDFEEFYLTPNNLLSLQLSIIKILILEYFSEDMPIVKGGMKTLFRGLVTFFYFTPKYYNNLKIWEKIHINLAYYFLIFWDKKNDLIWDYFCLFIKILKSNRIITKTYQNYYYLKEQIYWVYTPQILQKIISLIPFTLLLYGKYNLYIGGIGIFLGYYFIFRMSRVFLTWLILYYRSFYEFCCPTRWERIFNRICYPLIVVINLMGIIGSFYLLSLLNKYMGINIQFLGIIFYTIVRYIIVDLIIYKGGALIFEKGEVKDDSPFYMKWRNKLVKGVNDYLQF